jgi:hypothetical protein
MSHGNGAMGHRDMGDSESNMIIYKPIPGCNKDFYRAGTDGKIYSGVKTIGFGKPTLVDWYPMKFYTNKKGYQFVGIIFNGKKVTKTVHRLICLAFHGIPISPKYQTRHLDGNRSNNKPSNLVWGTQEENWLDRKAHGNGNSGEDNPSAKLTDEEYSHVRWAIKMGLCSQERAAKALGFSRSGMSTLIHQRRKGKCG